MGAEPEGMAVVELDHLEGSVATDQSLVENRDRRSCRRRDPPVDACDHRRCHSATLVARRPRHLPGTCRTPAERPDRSVYPRPGAWSSSSSPSAWSPSSSSCWSSSPVPIPAAAPTCSTGSPPATTRPSSSSRVTT